MCGVCIKLPVQQNECLSKYAIILIDPADKSYIPTKYLQADPRQFSMDNVEDIVGFMRGIPSHSMSLPSSEREFYHNIIVIPNNFVCVVYA